jgi:anti-sigma factor RsiW
MGLSCQELVERVTDYLDGALAPGERARFEAHVAECGGCASHLEQVLATIALTRAAGDREAPPPEMAGLLAAFRRARRHTG